MIKLSLHGLPDDAVEHISLALFLAPNKDACNGLNEPVALLEGPFIIVVSSKATELESCMMMFVVVDVAEEEECAPWCLPRSELPATTGYAAR